jgi:hypothetical protein
MWFVFKSNRSRNMLGQYKILSNGCTYSMNFIKNTNKDEVFRHSEFE